MWKVELPWGFGRASRAMLMAFATLFGCSNGSELTDPTTFAGTTAGTIDPANGHLGRFPGRYPHADSTVAVGPNAAGQFAGVALFTTKEAAGVYLAATIWEWTRKVGFVDLETDAGMYAHIGGGSVQLNDNGTVLTWAYHAWPGDGRCDLFVGGQPVNLSAGLPAGTYYVCLSPTRQGGVLHADNSIDVWWYASGHYGLANRGPNGTWTLGPPIL